MSDSPARRALPILDAELPIDRRHALKTGLSLAVTAVLVSACGGGGGDADAPTGPGTGDARAIDVTLQLAATPALGTVGGIARVGTGLRSVAVVRSAADRYRAFSLICPHAGTIVGIEGGAFRCANHGSRFAADGALVQGPATVGLQELTVAFDAAAGTVRVTGRV
jgi:Rieske Fe-S protein